MKSPAHPNSRGSGGLKFGNYLRIRGGSRRSNAKGRTLFANGVRRSVMLFEWLSPSMGLTTFLTMTRFGVSNGSVAFGYNTSVPSDPRITVCLTQLPPGETNPLSARARSWQTKTTAKISVGLLPYISIVSVWQRRRPVVTNLGACHHRLCIDTSSCRLVTLAELTASANAIPRRSYLFGASWPDVRRTLLMAVEQDGDPSDSGNHSVLLRAFDTARSSPVLGRVQGHVRC